MIEQDHSALFKKMKDWLASHQAEIHDRGLGALLDESPNDGRDKSSMWLDVDSNRRAGRLILWSSGEAELEVIDFKSGNFVLNEHREITSQLGLDDALSSLLAGVEDTRNS